MKEFRDTGYYAMEDGTIIGKLNKPLKPRLRGKYHSIRIHNGDIKKGNISVHTIISECYLGIKPNDCVVNHKDGNKLNNDINNLEYITRSENQLHAYKLGLQKANKKLHDNIIISEYKNGLNGLQISKKYSVNFKRIYSVIKKYKQS